MPTPAVEEKWPALPGRKVLVAGALDVDDSGQIDHRWYDRVETIVWIPTDGGVALTHEPLWSVPAGSINIHGAPESTRWRREGRRVCACTDHIGLAPTELKTLLEELDGRDAETGKDGQLKRQNTSLPQGSKEGLR